VRREDGSASEGESASVRLFADLERAAHEVAAAAQAAPFYAPEGGPLDTFATMHPLGGCPMGDDAADGVVDDLGLDVRPHWGQFNALTPARVRHLYTCWDQWLATNAGFNSTRVLNSPFTRRVGVS
jgi:hypothetical protein